MSLFEMTNIQNKNVYIPDRARERESQIESYLPIDKYRKPHTHTHTHRPDTQFIGSCVFTWKSCSQPEHNRKCMRNSPHEPRASYVYMYTRVWHEYHPLVTIHRHRHKQSIWFGLESTSISKWIKHRPNIHIYTYLRCFWTARGKRI